MKLIWLPSGDHCGWLSPFSPKVTCRAGELPSAATFQTRVRASIRSLSASHWRTVYSTCLPSGEMAAAANGLHVQHVVKGRGRVWARAAPAEARTNTAVTRDAVGLARTVVLRMEASKGRSII